MRDGAPAPYVLGLDLGGSKLHAALEAGDGTVLSELVAATPYAPGSLVGDLVAACERVVAAAGVPWEEVRVAAVGVPGAVREGSVTLAPNVVELSGEDFATVLADRLGTEVVLDNDVNLAALGEHRYGRAVGIESFVFIAVGTGVGMGIVADGQVYRGATGAAGEIGLLPLGTDPFDPMNQLRGALEETVGGIGLGRRYAVRHQLDTAEATADRLFALAQDGDEDARTALDEHARAASLGVVAVQSVLDPTLVVFGGGIGVQPEFVERVRRYVRALTSREISIEVSLLGKRAGVIGAGSVAREHVLRAAGDGALPSGAVHTTSEKG